MRDRVIVIPGNHDINRKACAAYFDQCAADETKPTEPWFPKWNHYKAAFDDFYVDCKGVCFTPDEPWSLFKVPELKIVVAGLNSTIREGHDEAVNGLPERERGHYGWCGERQLGWFEEKLSGPKIRGWLRIGAVHHNEQRGCKGDDENLRDADMLEQILRKHLDLLLHGHTHQAKTGWVHPDLPIYSTGSTVLDREIRPEEIPNRYQILQIFRDRICRFTRCYYPEYRSSGADPRGSRTSDDWRTQDKVDFSKAVACFPPSGIRRPQLSQGKSDGEAESEILSVPHHGILAARQDDFLTRVAEACALRHDGAKIEEARRHSDRLHYLRVACRESGVVRQFPVGTSSVGCLIDDLDRFYEQVVVQYRANDSGLLADFVYGGHETTAPQTRDHAARLGLRLLSFIEYQGLIDFRDYLKLQTSRLLADPVYPPSVYVPQRMQFRCGAVGTLPATPLAPSRAGCVRPTRDSC